VSVKDWTRTAADNVDLSKDGWPEGMNRSSVNNQARAGMAALRTLIEDGEWNDLLSEHLADFTVSRVSPTQFRVTDDNGTNATSKFPVGSWVKVTGTSSPTVSYGRISAVSSYGAGPSIDVTLADIVDASYASSTLPDTTVTLVECYWNRRIRQAAFHPVGKTTSQAPAEIPTIDDLGDGATLNQGTGGGFDADTVDGHHAQTAGGLMVDGQGSLRGCLISARRRRSGMSTRRRCRFRQGSGRL
jgi:hypothetical protein